MVHRKECCLWDLYEMCLMLTVQDLHPGPLLSTYYGKCLWKHKLESWEKAMFALRKEAAAKQGEKQNKKSQKKTTAKLQDRVPACNFRLTFDSFLLCCLWQGLRGGNCLKTQMFCKKIRSQNWRGREGTNQLWPEFFLLKRSQVWSAQPQQ